MFKVLNPNLITQLVQMGAYSQLDPFFISDLYASMAEDKYYLQIQDNNSGKTVTYNVVKVLIDPNNLSNNIVKYQLELKDKNSINSQTQTFNFNISQIEQNKDIVNITDPKYYIYCNNSTKISFRFWFLRKE